MRNILRILVETSICDISANFNQLSEFSSKKLQNFNISRHFYLELNVDSVNPINYWAPGDGCLVYSRIYTTPRSYD